MKLFHLCDASLFFVFFKSLLIYYVSQSLPLWSTSVVKAGDIQQGVKDRNLFKKMPENLIIIVKVIMWMSS